MEPNEIETETGYNIGRAVSVGVPPELTFAVALGSVGRYYSGGIGALVGAAIGYFIGRNSEVTDDDKRDIVTGILEARENLIQEETGIEGDDYVENSGILNSADLLNYRYNMHNFSGKWADFVGQPSIRFHAMIYGRPKQGKSILAVQWAKYLSENFGKVLYVASEEGFSVTLQKKVSEFAMNNQNLDFANFRDYDQIRSALSRSKYKFVFIDSVNYINVSPEQIEDIKAENPNTAFITIQQATKNGNFRGSQQFAHNCDIVIRVEDGIASQQGRYQVPSEMAVFDKPEKVATENSPMLGGSEQMSLFDDDEMEANF